MFFKHIWRKQHPAFPLASPMCHQEKHQCWGGTGCCFLRCCALGKEGEKMPIRRTKSPYPLPWIAFSGSQLSPLGPWEMLNFNWLRGVLSVSKTAENWEIRVLFPLLMLNRFAQTHPTYSTALGQNLGLAPGVKFVMGSAFPAAALEAG